MLKANPLNIIMLEDRQDQPVRPRDEDILRHLGFSEEAINEQLQENRKQDDLSDKSDSVFDREDIERDCIDLDADPEKQFK